MRFFSLGLCTVLALGCGAGDQSVIDPNFVNPRTGSDGANAEPGAERPRTKPNVGEPSRKIPGTTSQPTISACEESPAEGEVCSSENPDGNAASMEGELPTGSGGASGTGDGDDSGDDTPGDGTGSGEGAEGPGGAGAAEGKAGSSGETPDDGSGGSGGKGEGSAGAGGGNEPEQLPDLIIDGTYLMATVQQDVVDASADLCLFNEGCVTGEGLRRVVRFGTRSANVGVADVIIGEPVAGNPLWEFDVCHEHFHFEGYARYDLVEASSGEVLPIGNKNGFCLRDLDNWSNPSCATYDCDYQGISAGCADVYTPDLDCQWVDITDVAPGLYELVVTVNTEQLIREASFENNSATVTIEILPETIRVVP